MVCQRVFCDAQVSDDHCQSVGRLSKFQNSTAHFGLSTNSFQKFTIPKDVSKRYMVEGVSYLFSADEYNWTMLVTRRIANLTL